MLTKLLNVDIDLQYHFCEPHILKRPAQTYNIKNTRRSEVTNVLSQYKIYCVPGANDHTKILFNLTKGQKLNTEVGLHHTHTHHTNF